MPAFDREVLGGRENVPNNRFPTSITYLVQACQPSLACCDLRSLTQIQIPSPYQLPSAYPAHGCREGCPLTIIAPGQNGPLLHCQDRSLFRSLGSSDDTDGPIRVWATLSRNFVSHIRKSHRTRVLCAVIRKIVSVNVDRLGVPDWFRTCVLLTSC